MVMRFPAKKTLVAQKHRAIFRQEKMVFFFPMSGCLGTPLPLPQSLYVRTDGRTGEKPSQGKTLSGD